MVGLSVETFMNGIKQSKTLKYFNVDGIDLSGQGTPTPIQNIMTGLARVNTDSNLECLSMRRCKIGDIMLTDRKLSTRFDRPPRRWRAHRLLN